MKIVLDMVLPTRDLFELLHYIVTVFTLLLFPLSKILFVLAALHYALFVTEMVCMIWSRRV